MDQDAEGMTTTKFVNWDQVKPGDTVRIARPDGEFQEFRIAACAREKMRYVDNIAVAFHGVLRKFTFYSKNRAELVIRTICSVCGAPADLLCTKPVWQYARCRTMDLVVGDRTCRIGEWKPKINSSCSVEEIQKLGRQFYAGRWEPELFEITLRIMRAKHPDRLKSIIRLPDSFLRRAAEGPCGVPICENCAQDPGEPHRYCPDHWLIRTMELAA